MTADDEKEKEQDKNPRSRFTLKLVLLSDRDDIIRTLRACSVWSVYVDRKISIPRSWNIFPGYQLPVLVRRGKEHEVVLMNWGLPPRKPEHSPICYVRARSALAPGDACNWLWALMRGKGRCVIICNGFYHWQYRNKKPRPYICEDERSDPVLLAGLWKKDHVNGQEISSFIIITQQGIPSNPNEGTSIQPIVIPDRNIVAWLEGDEWNDNLCELLPGDSGTIGCGLRSRQVGMEIQTSEANEESLAETKETQEDEELPANSEAGASTPRPRWTQGHRSQASSSSRTNATPSSSQSSATLASFWSNVTPSSSISNGKTTITTPGRISIRPREISRPGSGECSLPKKRRRGKGKQPARRNLESDAGFSSEGSPSPPSRKRKKS